MGCCWGSLHQPHTVPLSIAVVTSILVFLHFFLFSVFGMFGFSVRKDITWWSVLVFSGQLLLCLKWKKKRCLCDNLCLWSCPRSLRMLECWILNRKDWLDFLVLSYHIKGALPIWNTGLVFFFFFPQLEMNEE